MSPTEIYEVKANAFYRMTGYMAPGKSVASEMIAYQDMETRRQLWALWHEVYRPLWDAMIRAFEDEIEKT